MPKVRVYRYKRYDIETDDNFISTRMATQKKIDQIRASAIYGTERQIDESLLTDGWTEKDFDPDDPKKSN